MGQKRQHSKHEINSLFLILFISLIIFTDLFLYFLEISWEIWKWEMDNDRDVVEKAARYIFYIIYDEASLSGLVMALSALVSTIGHRIDCHR